MADSTYFQPRHGFTLIELSIVLVIIGLLVGGVLVGRDLINAARIRATISQFQRYNEATLVFRNKYNCLPGDCATAFSYGMSGNQSINLADGDGNGKVLFFHAPNLANTDEMLNYWAHLSEAKLITDRIDLTQYSPGKATPQTKIPISHGSPWNAAGGWWIFNNQDLLPNGEPLFYPEWGNGHVLLIIDDVGDGYDMRAIKPTEAKILDQKLDDGLPSLGSVRAGPEMGNGDITPMRAADDCIETSGGQTIYTARTNSFCSIALKATF